MTMCTSPMGHVPLSDLLDRQSLLRASRGSCNKNILYYSSTKLNQHTVTTIYVYMYSYTYIFNPIYIYTQRHSHPSLCIIYPNVPNHIHILMYVYTLLYIYMSSQHIRYRCLPSSRSTKKHIRLCTISIYIFYTSSPANNLKFQTHLQVVLILV